MTQRSKVADLSNLSPVSVEIRRIRQDCGLSQEALASGIGYSVKQVVRWENGSSLPRRLVLEAIRELPRQTLRVREAATTPHQFTFIDLFAGIGGLRRAFEPLGGKCVFTSEWDANCQRTYRANYATDHPLAGDIVKIPSEAVPPHDLLLAGFPCQPFSLAGVSKKNSLGRPHGFECDTQGTLFFEIERILRYHRPRAFLLENVKHLLRHDSGRTWEVILKVLREDLGYNVHFKVIDAASLLPQHRERVYVVGFAQPTEFAWGPWARQDVSSGPRLNAVLHPEDGTELPDEQYLTEAGQVRSKYTLSSHLWKYLREYAAKHRARGNGFGYSLVGPQDVARTLSARYHKDGSEILVRRGRGNPRRLTPRECARLMGFDPLLGSPPEGKELFVIPVSDTQAYRQFGNSIAVPVACEVARLMGPFLIEHGETSLDYTRQLELRLAS